MPQSQSLRKWYQVGLQHSYWQRDGALMKDTKGGGAPMKEIKGGNSTPRKETKGDRPPAKDTKDKNSTPTKDAKATDRARTTH